MTRDHGDIIHVKNYIIPKHSLNLGFLGKVIYSQFAIRMGVNGRKKCLIIIIFKKK